jgi:hypothetical protein
MSYVLCFVTFGMPFANLSFALFQIKEKYYPHNLQILEMTRVANDVTVHNHHKRTVLKVANSMV